MLCKLSCKMVARAKPIFPTQKRLASTLPLSSIKMSKEMFNFHLSLPRLPVPPLHSSLEKYLKSVRPLLTDEEYHNTCKIIKEFSSPVGLGVKLHSELVKKSKTTENWLREYWVNSAYLSARNSLMTNSTCGIVDKIQVFNSDEDHLRFSAKYVAGLLDLKNHVDNHTLAADVMRGQALDMTQYYDVFNTCRVPGSPLDSHIFSYLGEDRPDYIVIARNNHYFSCKVYDDSGKALNENQLYSLLKKVVLKTQEPEIPVGILTTMNRDKWFKAYETLRKYDPLNEKSIETIQKSILILCLDKPVTNKDTPNRISQVASHFIHGGGAEKNSGNRWFDKCLQVIVNRDGSTGISFEHSIIDGMIFIRLNQHLFDYTKRNERNESCYSTSVSEPNKLQFNVSKDVFEFIEDAKRDLKCFVDDLDMSCFTFENYGTSYLKSKKLSTDSFIQMALQLAFYKIHGEACATYESATTRKFLFGRTDVIRSTSVESANFCRKMIDPSACPSSKVAALRYAVDAHKQYSYQAANGMAIDRLFLGLKLIALETGMNAPVLFEDVGYSKSTYYRLSTSQVPLGHGTFGCYGVLTPDGYGCCYNPQPSSILFPSSASNSCHQTSANDFNKAVTEALIEMQDVIERSSNK